MRGVVKILVIVLLVLMVGGFAPSLVINVRNAAQRMRCQNNLRMVIGLALQNYHDACGHFPSGTVANATLPPDKRLSGLTQIKPYMESAPKALLDYTKSWDADVNSPPRWLVGTKENTGPSRVELIGDISYFFCPANPARNDPSLPCPTHYASQRPCRRKCSRLSPPLLAVSESMSCHSNQLLVRAGFKLADFFLVQTAIQLIYF